MIDGLEVIQAGWVGSLRCFGVLKADDDDVVRVSEAAVPFIVVPGSSETEAAAVDGQEGGKQLGRGEVVALGEEDAGQRLAR
jgi:hypothetical protein